MENWAPQCAMPLIMPALTASSRPVTAQLLTAELSLKAQFGSVNGRSTGSQSLGYHHGHLLPGDQSIWSIKLMY